MVLGLIGPLLLRIYINDISDDISSDLFLFADDSLLDEVVSPTVSADKLNCDLMSSVSTLASKWLVIMNVNKTKSMVFSSKVNKPIHLPLFLSNNLIEYVIVHGHMIT